MSFVFVDKIIDLIMSVIGWIKRTTIATIAISIEVAIMLWLMFYFFAETLILTLTPTFMRTQKSLKGKVVVLTGGAGGVGQELALRLARADAKVVLWDINEEAMVKVKDNLEKEGHQAYCYTVDVTDRKNVYKNADLVKQEVGVVDILINNAGIVCGNTFLDIPDYMIEKTFQVNILSNYWTVKAFLPDMLRKGKGHIVTRHQTRHHRFPRKFTHRIEDARSSRD
ncbi:short chain dehydrogenase [Popillia japonica]|uniref:Short chain dehydrogenase n=1 Tax=Popillia japonica TaxID=7064 RepID=A0AAW1L369_POPJA